ncbi:hypothetical protein BS50DRAFT_86957 [Corynespora cassiicola Philippines]|uniref:Uncharacterized protein n=1 Tax=Corynespora cassiicola Philippines TaxID=1448308 RepID=A0A2T2NEN3_CORCC|nr:hypothetical protein BS50DRAFT_86957 [Corynespora cassiicola Philippines]
MGVGNGDVEEGNLRFFGGSREEAGCWAAKPELCTNQSGRSPRCRPGGTLLSVSIQASVSFVLGRCHVDFLLCWLSLAFAWFDRRSRESMIRHVFFLFSFLPSAHDALLRLSSLAIKMPSLVDYENSPTWCLTTLTMCGYLLPHLIWSSYQSE